MKKEYLLAPGPTAVPPEALAAAARPIVHHRAPAYEALVAEVRAGLKYLFQTEQEVITLCSSGTGAMEAAVVNTMSPRETALVIQGGKFGERWGEICEAYGVTVIPIDVEWGKSVDPEQVKTALAKYPEISAVFATHSETSTGVLHDVEALARIVRRAPTLLVVDAVSSLGATDLPMDAWGIDVVVSGSQKGLMIPPGLGFCALSEKAWATVKRSRLPKYYFDLAEERKEIVKNQTVFTPAVSLVVALKEALDLIRKEGLPNVFARHDTLARATRAGVSALGLQLVTERPSPALTALWPPKGIAAKALLTTLRDKYGVTMIGGQGKWEGKILRIAHLGYAGPFDVIVALSSLEFALADHGYPVKIGEGVRAAQEILMQ